MGPGVRRGPEVARGGHLPQDGPAGDSLRRSSWRGMGGRWLGDCLTGKWAGYCQPLALDVRWSALISCGLIHRLSPEIRSHMQYYCVKLLLVH
jgi:hypothetical protein